MERKIEEVSPEHKRKTRKKVKKPSQK